MRAPANARETCLTPDPSRLRRVVKLWPFVFFGLGVIVGAGVYVAIGEVIGRAGSAAPLSFLIAGVAALLSGLCYAELAGRFPEASGAAAYVRHVFASDTLAAVVGIATTVAVAIAAASITLGAVTYLATIVPLPAPTMVIALLAAFTAVAAAGVQLGVGLAAAIGVLEIGGLLAAIAAGFAGAHDFDLGRMLPTNPDAWSGVVSGAFTAFFAFMGFETMANLGEEVERPRQNLPRGIVLAVVASLILYVTVAAASVLADSPPDSPLLGLFEGRAAGAFALIGAIAISNGVLVEIMMLARLFYGFANAGQLPRALASVNERTRTPAIATMVAGSVVLVAALALPFGQLLALSNALTLAIFVLVDLALWRLHRDRVPQLTQGYFVAPRWVPPVGAAVSALLIAAEALR